MPWWVAERRGPPWRQGWRDRTLSSLSLPPPPLLAVFVIVLFFLFISHYIEYRAKVQRAGTGLRFLLLLIPIGLFLVARHGVVVRVPWPERERVRRAGSSPWVVGAVVVVLLVMVTYQSSFHSRWLLPFRRPVYYNY